MDREGFARPGGASVLASAGYLLIPVFPAPEEAVCLRERSFEEVTNGFIVVDSLDRLCQKPSNAEDLHVGRLAIGRQRNCIGD